MSVRLTVVVFTVYVVRGPDMEPYFFDADNPRHWRQVILAWLWNKRRGV